MSQWFRHPPQPVQKPPESNMLSHILVPVIVSILTGGASAYLGVSVTLAVLNTKMEYVEKELSSIAMTIDEVQRYRRKLLSIEDRVEDLESGRRQ